MGKHIRKVPRDWEHPRDSSGSYLDLRDPDEFEEDMQNYHIEKEEGDEPPNPAEYADYQGREACCYQVYTDTGDEYPISRIFETLDEAQKWCAERYAECYTSAQVTDAWRDVLLFREAADHFESNLLKEGTK